MAMSRSLGGMLLTTLSPMRISPPLICSRPAIMRSKVDLPQPDGPTKTQNSPSSISTETPLMMWVWPKYLCTPSMETDAIQIPCIQLNPGHAVHPTRPFQRETLAVSIVVYTNARPRLYRRVHPGINVKGVTGGETRPLKDKRPSCHRRDSVCLQRRQGVSRATGHQPPQG